ncbi:hypothetical protein DFH07DRAFT_1038554 [Mycena maculata]|uniref:Uncharacterized protein n=1 Tax=Mycena maculata TaxID=230809 RepID=A0AAD7N5B2_9AGAR|nr:hypothetical protein DFH07DRAFT_1038554 [Mycena maculata]
MTSDIAAELAELKEMCRQSSAREKELREKLKSVKSTAGPAKRGRQSSRAVVVSSSSTGRVRTTVVPGPASPIEVENTAAAATVVPALPDSSASTSTFEWPVDDHTQWDQLEFSSGAQMAPSAAFTPSFDFNFGVQLAPSAPFAFAFDAFTAPTPTYFPDHFGPTDLTTASMTIPDYPTFSGREPSTMDELLNSQIFGPYTPSADIQMSGISVDYGVSNFPDQLPTLPAPPTPSDLSSPPHISAPTIPRKRRQEVDEANIITSSRVRVKSMKLQEIDCHKRAKTKVCPSRF